MERKAWLCQAHHYKHMQIHTTVLPLAMIAQRPIILVQCYPERACARGCSEKYGPVHKTSYSIQHGVERNKRKRIRSYNYIIMTDIGYYYFTIYDTVYLPI